MLLPLQLLLPLHQQAPLPQLLVWPARLSKGCSSNTTNMLSTMQCTADAFAIVKQSQNMHCSALSSGKG
jgi:hypothetical protein